MENVSNKKVTLKEVQQTEFEILQVIDKICKKNKIPYWLTDGTLLGARRHDGFIPWDDDIDLCLMREDYKRLVEILPGSLPKAYRIVLKGDVNAPLNKKAPHLTGLVVEKKGAVGFVDFFQLDKVFKNRFLGELTQKLYKYFVLPKRQGRQKGFKKIRGFSASFAALFIEPEKLEEKIFNLYKKGNGFQYRYSLSDSKFNHFFTPEMVLPLGEIQFEGKTFPAPANVHAYLTEIYGPSYMTPPPMKKRKPMHVSETNFS